MVQNSVVALIPAIILADGIVTLDGVPAISDVDSLVDIMETMGATVKRDGETLEIDPRGVKTCLCRLAKLIACVHPTILRFPPWSLWSSCRWFTRWL